jgi:hypothetical protein
MPATVRHDLNMSLLPGFTFISTHLDLESGFFLLTFVEGLVILRRKVLHKRPALILSMMG